MSSESNFPSRPDRTTDIDTGEPLAGVCPENAYQVILYNDEVNSTHHVVRSLMKVFGHPPALAEKIMLEAHFHGEAIAEVESQNRARLHRNQLVSFGLSASVQKV